MEVEERRKRDIYLPVDLVLLPNLVNSKTSTRPFSTTPLYW